MILKRYLSVIVISIVLIAPCIIKHFEPSISKISICLSKNYLGISCPGCNLTGAVHEAIHLRLLSSISMHPAGPIALLCVVFALLVSIASLLDYCYHVSLPLNRLYAVQLRMNKAFGVFLVVFWASGFIPPAS